MLSRIAEALFWIGRYVDRADNTARLLDVHFNVLLEDPWVDEPTANASLLTVMNCEHAGIVTRDDVLALLANDPHAALVDRGHADVGSRERPARARGHLHGGLGIAQHDVAAARLAFADPSTAHLLRLGP